MARRLRKTFKIGTRQMRPPSRIQPFLDELKQFWLKNPDLRFMQIVSLFHKEKQPCFYTEDDVLLERLKEFQQKEDEQK